ncbi:MAG: hypothetical protein ACXWNM_19405, partial [Vulcanimicrobiaceae bacterium]
KLEKRLGIVGALCAGVALTFVGRALLPMASLGFPLVTAALSLILTSAAAPIYNVTQLSYRQRVTPLEMQARMHATMRTINSMATPLGAIAGGMLATSVGTTGTLVVASALTLGSVLWFWVPSARMLFEDLGLSLQPGGGI